jgi:hypothetical protein
MNIDKQDRELMLLAGKTGVELMAAMIVGASPNSFGTVFRGEVGEINKEILDYAIQKFTRIQAKIDEKK